MNEDIDNIQYSPVRDFKYAHWFEDVQYNGKTLSDLERKKLICEIDEAIASFSEGLPMMDGILEDTRNLTDEFHSVDRTVVSVILFVLMTMIDIMVACKYFILADKDYDRRFMRGKLFVILNEGFKKLYGFNENGHKKSEWDKLQPLMKYFPEEINLQYQELTGLLEKHSKSSSWWKEERNLETHLDIEQLYKSRQEELIESKVMMDSLKLFNALMAVEDFLTKMHRCLLNYLAEKYRKGELSET